MPVQCFVTPALGEEEVIDWIGLCRVLRPRQVTTQYRLYGRRFLQVKRPNQQYQSTEGESCQRKQPQKQKENKNYTYAYTHKIVDKYSVQL